MVIAGKTHSDGDIVRLEMLNQLKCAWQYLYLLANLSVRLQRRHHSKETNLAKHLVLVRCKFSRDFSWIQMAQSEMLQHDLNRLWCRQAHDLHFEVPSDTFIIRLKETVRGVCIDLTGYE